MWQEQLIHLQQGFPDVVKLYRPATTAQIRGAEQLLGLRLADIDPDWPEFLQLTNGASIMVYCLAGAATTRFLDLADLNTGLWDLDLYSWIREHFLGFMPNSSPMNIGFVRDGQRMRCVAFLSELTDLAVLPIASSFGRFMKIVPAGR